MFTAVIAIGLTGAACGAVLAVAARLFAVHEDPRVEELMAALPGVNCGGCGFAGCADYAKAIARQQAPLNLCAPGGAETVQKLAAVMGVAAAPLARKVAIVLCGGDRQRAARKFCYNGIADCAAAAAVGGGDKLCGYGCLGYGSCARVCPVNAIEITPGGIARVHPELCIGCGRCVRACPRRLIHLVPAERFIHVLCSSKDKGPVVKKACQVGCIGCTLCTKLAGGAIKMDGALAVVDYAQPLENEAVIEKCPGHCIVKVPAT